MRFRVVSSKNEILDLNQNERMVHLAFRPSNMDFLKLMESCPRLRAVQIPPSYNKTMSKAIKLFLEMQGIELLEGDVWGHRKDIDEYFIVDEDAIDKIGSLVSKGDSIEETTAEVQKATRMAPDLIRFIAKTKMTA